MTDRITKLAVEAGMTTVLNHGYTRFASPQQLQRFAELVRNDVLDECAKVCDDAMEGIWQFHPEYVNEVGRNCCTNLAARIRNLKS